MLLKIDIASLIVYSGGREYFCGTYIVIELHVELLTRDNFCFVSGNTYI